MPDNLKIQESIIMEMLQIMGIKHLKVDGYEADDIIGTLVTNLGKDKENNIFILSGDKDLYQFIDGNVAIYDTMKHRIFHEAEAREKFAVDPKYIVDYLAICGDTSDNIPGVPGFGPKKAESLINEYGTLENIYENIENITGKTREILENNREIAFISKKLATIDTVVPLDNFSLTEHVFSERNFLTPEVISFFTEYDFRSLLPKEHIQTKDFSSLNLKQISLLGDKEIDTCFNLLKNTRTVSIATYGERFALVGGSIYFGDEDIYTFETNIINLKPLFEEILSGNYKVIGYDLKKDLERIEAYLEGESSKEKSGQMGLF